MLKVRNGCSICFIAYFLVCLLGYAQPVNANANTCTASRDYCTTDNPFYPKYGGQCTSYAWGRAWEKFNIKLSTHGHAYKWDDDTVTDENTGKVLTVDRNIQPDSIAVFNGGSVGHVAYVESVVNGEVTFTEANWSQDPCVKEDYGCGYSGSKTLQLNSFETRGDYTVTGYIHLPPPVFIYQIGGKSSGILRIQGLDFGDTKGTVRVRYSELLNPARVDNLPAAAIQWTSNEIQIELFALNGFDWALFNTPILLEFFKPGGEKIGEIWYPFVDVPMYKYYSLPAVQLWKKGILNGVTKGNYHGNYRFLLPEEEDTRAEFIKKLVEVTGYGPCIFSDSSCNAIPPFNDITPDHWAYGYVARGYNLGWITANPTFNPNNGVTRAEAAKWLVKAKDLGSFPSVSG